MAWIMARIPLRRAFAIAARKLTEPIIIDFTRFLIEEATFEMKALMDFTMAIKPFLIEIMILLTARAMPTKKFLIAFRILTKNILIE